jgi:hypothetical protein
MRKEYKDELEALRQKMLAAEAFAEKIPCLAEKILDWKLTGNEQWQKFGNRYKKIPLAWSINRGFFSSETNRYISNYGKPHSGYFFSIYINSISLFDIHNLFDLKDAVNHVDVFFFDEMSTNFYVTDENIGELLEALSAWYERAIVKLKAYNREKEIEETKKKLAKLEGAA